MAARRLLAPLVAALLLQGAATAAPPVVTWVTPDLSNDTNNFGNHYLSFLMGRLPAFDHHVMQGSFGRVWHEMQSKRAGACVFNAIKTPEREAVAVFSRRPLLWPAYRLYFSPPHRAAFTPYLDSEGRVDLGKLTAAPLHGAVTASRAYNSVIDGFINAHNKARPLDSLLSTRQILNLVRAEHLDFAFATLADIEQHDGSLDSLPIAGGDAWNPSYVACTRDKTGLAVIAAVDEVFEEQENWAEYVEPLRSVLPAADYAVVLRSKP